MPQGGSLTFVENRCSVLDVFQSIDINLNTVMNRPVVILIGAGGHASSVIDCIKQSEAAVLFGLLDENAASLDSVDGVPVLGDDSLLPELRGRGVTHFSVTVGSSRYNPVRKRLFEMAENCGLNPFTVLHPCAMVSPSAIIGEGAQLLAGSSIGAGARIGENAVINTGAIVEHHGRVEAHAHLASGSCIAGHVRVGAETFVGARAVVRQGVVIGARCTVGMGSVVLRDVAEAAMVYGVPAKTVL